MQNPYIHGRIIVVSNIKIGIKKLWVLVVPMSSSHYLKVSNISGTLAGNEIVDHSDAVGASPVGAAPTTSSFST